MNNQTTISSLDCKSAIEKNGFYSTKIVGTSMNPFILQKRDTVFIVKKKNRLKKYDVALFVSRDGANVLHRVVKVRENSYDIIGDNCLLIDYVAECDVIGVLDGYYKGEKYVKCSSFLFKLKSRLFCVLPVRLTYIFFNRIGRKIKRLFSKNKDKN